MRRRPATLEHSIVYPKPQTNRHPPERIKTMLGGALIRTLRVESSDPCGAARSRARADEGGLPPHCETGAVFIPTSVRLGRDGQPQESPPQSSDQCTSRSRYRRSPIDYASRWPRAGSKRPPSRSRHHPHGLAMAFRFHISQYLIVAPRNWKAQGSPRPCRLGGTEWRSKFLRGDDHALLGGRRPAQIPRRPRRQRRIVLHELLRRVD